VVGAKLDGKCDMTQKKKPPRKVIESNDSR
ncbi:uncharacterized protein METZ01_LOCUS245296, partial [marine metagenome]